MSTAQYPQHRIAPNDTAGLVSRAKDLHGPVPPVYNRAEGYGATSLSSSRANSYGATGALLVYFSVRCIIGVLDPTVWPIKARPQQDAAET